MEPKSSLQSAAAHCNCRAPVVHTPADPPCIPGWPAAGARQHGREWLLGPGCKCQCFQANWVCCTLFQPLVTAPSPPSCQQLQEASRSLATLTGSQAKHHDSGSGGRQVWAGTDAPSQPSTSSGMSPAGRSSSAPRHARDAEHKAQELSATLQKLSQEMAKQRASSATRPRPPGNRGEVDLLNATHVLESLTQKLQQVTSKGEHGGTEAYAKAALAPLQLGITPALQCPLPLPTCIISCLPLVHVCRQHHHQDPRQAHPGG